MSNSPPPRPGQIPINQNPSYAIRPLSSVLSLQSPTSLSSPTSHCFTTVERALQIAPFYAKQTQLPQPQSHRKPLSHKDLREYTTLPHSKKQTQNKPNPTPPPKAPSINHRVSRIEHLAPLAPTDQRSPFCLGAHTPKPV